MFNKPGAAMLALLAAQAPAAVQAIPPPIFGFPDSGNHTELGVAYTFNRNTTNVQEAMLFGGNITQSQPQLSVNPALYQSIASYTGQYLVVMVDPDATTPENPTLRFILHWLAPNVTQSTSNNSSSGGVRTLSPPSAASGSTDFVSYRPPTPPETSSAHRYILYAFEQPADFTMPAAFAGLAGGTNRTNFNLTSFMSAAGLGRPAAAEFFYVSRQAQVPGTFVALAGGTYPGGNGDAIFETSPNAAAGGNGSASSSTGGTSGTGTSGSGSASSSSGTGSTTSGARSVMEGLWRTGIWGLLALL